MTAHVELARLAASLPTPVDAAGPARAYVESHDGAWRATFALDGGRRPQKAGPAFPLDRAGGRDARALVGLLNERLGSTPRRGPLRDLADAPSGGAAASRDDDAGPPEAPIVAEGMAAAEPLSRCAGCDGPLPEGSRPNRRTCKPACRERARYRRQAEAARADAGSGMDNLTLSEPSEAVAPEDVAGILADHVADVIAACNPDRTSSEVIEGSAPVASVTSRDARTTFPEDPGPPPLGAV